MHSYRNITRLDTDWHGDTKVFCKVQITHLVKHLQKTLLMTQNNLNLLKESSVRENSIPTKPSFDHS